jgi:hypothetical protein
VTFRLENFEVRSISGLNKNPVKPKRKTYCRRQRDDADHDNSVKGRADIDPIRFDSIRSAYELNAPPPIKEL